MFQLLCDASRGTPLGLRQAVVNIERLSLACASYGYAWKRLAYRCRCLISQRKRARNSESAYEIEFDASALANERHYGEERGQGLLIQRS
jgi:hypothetical protein